MYRKKNVSNYKQLVKAGNVRWKKFSRKDEQIKFLQRMHTIKGKNSHRDYMKHSLWKMFFPMLSWDLFLELYKSKKMKSKKLSKLSHQLFSGKRKVRGGCIFTAMAALVASVAAAASSAAGGIAATAATVGSAIAASSVASAAITGVVSGAATLAGEEIIKSVV